MKSHVIVWMVIALSQMGQYAVLTGRSRIYLAGGTCALCLVEFVTLRHVFRRLRPPPVCRRVARGVNWLRPRYMSKVNWIIYIFCIFIFLYIFIYLFHICFEHLFRTPFSNTGHARTPGTCSLLGAPRTCSLVSEHPTACASACAHPSKEHVRDVRTCPVFVKGVRKRCSKHI